MDKVADRLEKLIFGAVQAQIQMQAQQNAFIIDLITKGAQLTAYGARVVVTEGESIKDTTDPINAHMKSSPAAVTMPEAVASLIPITKDEQTEKPTSNLHMGPRGTPLNF